MARIKRSMRRSGLVVLPIVGALVFSGCPWAVGKSDIFESSLTVSRKNTNETIQFCNGEHPGDSTGRARCALDLIRLACHLEPVPNFSVQECDEATDHFYTGDMRISIQEILSGQEVAGKRKACLYFEFPHWVGIEAWYSVPVGSESCF